ncbi:ribonuclease H [Senna tora]|uniref:Ribonuclease H n=1 Tax=Senna tora TaxID=362788 RepID=A0A834X454_9FABA|nr:ribonuclease H [Senna tora]
MLFGEAYVENAKVMTSCLKAFGDASGQRVSAQKSKIFFTKNVNSELRQSILSITNFSPTDDLERYLGMPLLHGRMSRSKFLFILDKVKARLSGWKRNCLSLAGRTTLARSVISSMPYFAMQSTKIPKSICFDIEKHQRQFIWGHEEGTRKVHAVNWRTVCLHRNDGGLGVKSRDSSAKSQDSVLWKNVVNLWDKLQSQQRWCIGNGRSTLFWSDVWEGLPSPLTSFLRVSMEAISLDAKVADFIGEDGNWRLEEIDYYLNDSGNGKFSVKAAYLSLSPRFGAPSVWRRIWHVKVPERIRMFLWQAHHCRLLIKFRCRRWNGGDVFCPWCPNVVEDEFHVLRDCKFAVNLWQRTVPSKIISNFFMGDITQWFNFNLVDTEHVEDCSSWAQFWAVGTWFLWKWRNKALFEVTYSRPSNPWIPIGTFVDMINKAGDPFLPPSPITPRFLSLVSWEKPPTDWVKINSDGALKMHPKRGGFGAIIRNDQGLWVKGVYGSLDNASVFKAEAWGAREGPILAKALGALSLATPSGLRFPASLKDIRILTKSFRGCVVNHRWREANRCADYLASLGTSCNSARVIIETPPADLKLLLLSDVMGIQLPRVVRA